ncbi:hypothetical protein MNBD_GAMMA18-1432 [hydrothermal vent metagenome]|uniref:Uncharacterized protein n=1 Tax=hydrothermal vent metagenome TaxID=652676 RepID=A0A3B0YUH4_9ZZZZ
MPDYAGVDDISVVSLDNHTPHKHDISFFVRAFGSTLQGSLGQFQASCIAWNPCYHV